MLPKNGLSCLSFYAHAKKPQTGILPNKNHQGQLRGGTPQASSHWSQARAFLMTL